MNRPIAASALCLTTIFLNACGIVAPERTAYSAQWPSLPPAASRRCAPPLGMFANASGRENLGKDSGFSAPTLAQGLGVRSQGDSLTVDGDWSFPDPVTVIGDAHLPDNGEPSVVTDEVIGQR